MNLLKALTRLVSSGGNTVDQSPPLAQALEHPVLGSLSPDGRFPNTLVGRVAYGSGHIDVRLDPEGGTMDEALALGASAVSSMPTLDKKCRDLIAAENLEGYNSGWRFGEVARLDGRMEPFANPILSHSEFCEKLKFKAIVVNGPSTLTFWYDDDGMFWGHSFYVDSFDGAHFTDTHVAMFG